MTLGDLLFRSDLPMDRAIVHSGSIARRRDELETVATDIACAAVDLGVRPGQAVAVMLGSGSDIIASLFGVWRAGCVYVPLNPRLTDLEIDRVLDAVEPALVITSPDLEHRLGERAHLVLDAGRVRQQPGAGGTRTHDADVALIQFTSGTTGAPKAVKLTHTGVLELIDGVLAKLRGRGSKDHASGGSAKAPMANLVPVSLSLWAGIYNVLFAFRTGAPVVLMDRFDPVEFRALVARHSIRSSVLPPAAMTMLIDDSRVTDLEPLRYVRSITAPLSPRQARRFRDRFGIAVLNGWGQTEIGGEIVGWTAADSREFGDAKLGAVGRPHCGVEIRVLDDLGEARPVGTTGELWVRTPAMSAGYADGTDLLDRLSPDGWFRTGDLGFVDDDGFVWVEGRVSDMINRGGLKVHPAEVEEVLRLSDDVGDAAVVGIADERLGEVPVAFVVPMPGRDPEPGRLLDDCRLQLAPYKVPTRVELIDALPRNDIGKVLTRELVERAGRPTETQPLRGTPS